MNPRIHTSRINASGHFTFTRCLGTLLTAAAFLVASATAPAADATFNGGSGNITGLAAGDTVTISSAGGAGISADYTYTDPATLASATISFTSYKTATALTSQFTLGTITLKSDQYDLNGGWANIYGTGGSDSRTFQFSEAGAGLTTNLNLQNIVISGFNSGGNHVMRIQNTSGASTSSTTNINGNFALISNTVSTGGGLLHHAGASNLVFTGTILVANNYNTNNHGLVYINSTGPMIFQNTAIFLSNSVSASNNGGAIYVNSTGGYLIANGDIIFENNYAGLRGGAIFYNADSFTTANIDSRFNGNASFIGNVTGTNQGGAIAFRGTAAPGYVRKMTFAGRALFQSNTAGGNGGAVEAEGSRQLEFLGEVIATGNSAGGSGGALITADQAIIINNTTGAPVSFLYNVAGGSGGAINGGSESGAISITTPASTVRFNNNAAAANGGAIRIDSSLAITAAAIQFIGNQSGTDGGAITTGTSAALDGSTPQYRIKLTGPATFADNIAAGSGGAIHTSGTGDNTSNIYISGSTTFSNNTSGSLGGAIYATGASSTITLDATTGNITFTGNKQGATITGALDAANRATISTGATAGLTATAGAANDGCNTNRGQES